jgi:glycine reductase
VEAQARGVPALNAMHAENAGLTNFRRQVLCIPTGTAVTELPAAVAKMAALAQKLGRGQALGSAEAEGYLPRGIREPVDLAAIGAERAVDMVLARVNGRPFRTEIPIASYDRVEPTPPVPDLAAARLAIVTSGGLVPRGNPDRLASAFAERFFRYSIADQPGLRLGEWESIHGGYSTRIVNSRNPNFVVPLDVVRELEAEGAVGSLHQLFYATVGNGTAVTDAKRMGAQIAEELVSEKVGAALFVAT